MHLLLLLLNVIVIIIIAIIKCMYTYAKQRFPKYLKQNHTTTLMTKKRQINKTLKSLDETSNWQDF